MLSLVELLQFLHLNWTLTEIEIGIRISPRRETLLKIVSVVGLVWAPRQGEMWCCFYMTLSGITIKSPHVVDGDETHVLWGPKWLPHLLQKQQSLQGPCCRLAVTEYSGVLTERKWKSQDLKLLNNLNNFISWPENQRVSTETLKGSFISYSRRHDIIENQMQNLIVQIAELHQFSSQPCKVFHGKVGHW